MVLGDATGAIVACELAAEHPERVSRIVLENCPFLPPAISESALLDPFKSTYRPSDASGFPVTRTIEFLLEQDPDHAPFAPTQSWMDRINRAQKEVGRDRRQALTAPRR